MVDSHSIPAQISEAALGPESEKVQALHLESSSPSSEDPEKAHQILEQDEDEMTPEEEKAMLRKIDFALVPFASLLYLLSFLDRVNIGQANAGSPGPSLTKTLGLKGDQYQVALSVFFIFYIVFEVPSNLLLKYFQPHRFISVIMICWAIVATLMGVVQNFGGLVATRCLLGLFEGGLYPALNFIFVCWYKRSELNLRIGILFAGATLSGAFGGILGYGLRHIDGKVPGLSEGWRWIFITELVSKTICLVTFVVALFCYWLVVDFPGDNERLLSKEQSRKWIRRITRSQGIATAQTDFEWGQVAAAFTDWKMYMYAVMYGSIATPLYGLALFTPAIIADLNFSGASANLLSVPPYVLGFITTIATAFISDRYGFRSPFIIFWMLVVVIAYIVLINDVPARGRYAAIHLAVAGVSPCIALAITWVGTAFGPVYKRGAAMGFFFTIGNGCGLISSNIYPATEKPRYIKGHAISLAFAVLAIICAAILLITNYRINKSRDEKYGKTSGSLAVAVTHQDQKKRYGLEHLTDKEVISLGDRHPSFRYSL